MRQRVDIIRPDLSHITQIAEIEKKCIQDGWSEKSFIEVLSNPNALIYSAVYENDIIGFLNGSYIIDEGELLNIAVIEKYREKGIACMLLNSFEQDLLKVGVNKVFLEVRESNIPAMSFYKKNGFVKNGCRKNYYNNPKENAVIMMKTY